jgi:hypothetical protein
MGVTTTTTSAVKLDVVLPESANTSFVEEYHGPHSQMRKERQRGVAIGDLAKVS